MTTRLRLSPWFLAIAVPLMLGAAALPTPCHAQLRPRERPPQLPASPEIPSANLAAAAAYSKEKKGKAFLVIQNGKVLKEEYDAAGPDARRSVLSGTKAIWVLAMLNMVDENLMTLDERAAETITEWADDPEKSQITIRQLLTFVSGLPVAGSLHRISTEDRFKGALELKLIGPPGTRFAYGPAHLCILYEVMRRKLRKRLTSPWDYMVAKVARPMDLPVTNERPDKSGQPLLASGFKFSPRDWARVGQMLLNQGYYRNKPIVSRQSFSQIFIPTTPNPSFGMELWLNRNASSSARELNVEDVLDKDLEDQRWGNACLSRYAPADMFVSLGSGGQRLYVVPSRNLIVVRMGAGGSFSDPYFLKLLFKK